MNRKIKLWSFICIAITFAMVFPNHIEALEPKYPTLRELIENDMIDLSEMSYAEPYGLDDQVAGVLTIYSSTSGNSSLTSLGLQGHAWITVRNYQKTRSYWTKSLSSNQFCSIGTWPSFITGYNGVWYNYERNKRSGYVNNSSQVTYAKQTFSPIAYSRLNSVINSYGKTWAPANNCTHFATKTWNSVSNIKLTINSNANTPSKLSNQIKSKCTYHIGVNDADFTSCSSSSVSHY